MMRYRLFILTYVILFFNSPLPAQNWTQMSGPFGGFTSALIQDPNGSILCVSAWGGCYRSADNGLTWTKIANNLWDDPTALVRTAAGEYFTSSVNGIHRSTDGGATFETTNNGLAHNSLAGLIARANGSLFAASLQDGVYRSTDNGDHWTAVNTGIPNASIDALLDPNTGVIYAASPNEGIFRSSDNGDHWTAANNGLKSLAVTAMILRSSGALLAATDSGLHQSTDAGATWIPIGNKGAVHGISMNASGDLFFLLDDELRRLKSGDAVWTALSDWHLVSYSRQILPLQDGSLLLAQWGGYGLLRSTDNGDHWMPACTGYTAQRILSLVTLANGTVFAGMTQAGLQHSTDNGEHWIFDSTGMNGAAVYAFAQIPGAYLFAGSSNGMFRSTDNGLNWVKKSAGLPIIVQGLLAGGSGELFAATAQGIFRSSDYGESWEERDAGITQKYMTCITRLAGGTLLAGHLNKGVYRSTDNGLNWTLVAGLPSNENTYTMFQHPGGRVFLGTNSATFTSSDDGANWTAGSFPHSANGFLLAPSGAFYLGSNSYGVYVSTDNGATWTEVNNGLATEQVNAIGLAGNGYLLAGTEAMSIFKSDVAVPVEFVSFTAQVKENRVLLRWTTTSESGNLGFGIERSAGRPDFSPAGAGWETRGFVRGSGTAADPKTYEFLDELPPAAVDGHGTMWYRLRQTDADGSSTLSDAVEVDLPPSPAGIALAQNSPNPFSQRTMIAFDIPGGAPLHARLIVRDMLGRTRITLAEGDYPAGRHQVSFIPPSTMRPGTYFAVLETPGGRLVRKMELLR